MKIAESTRRILRGVIVLGVTLAVLDIAWHHVKNTLQGKSPVIGYPLFANFNVNRYLDAFYLVAFVGPLLFLVGFHLLGRWGPLKRHVQKKHAIHEGSAPDGDEFDDAAGRSRSPAVHLTRLFGVGALLGLEILSGLSFKNTSTITVMALAGLIYAIVGFAVSLLIARARGSQTWTGVASVINIIGSIAMVPLLYLVSRNTVITIQSNGQIVHYPWLPIWLVIVATAVLVAYVGHRRVRSSFSLEKIEHHLIFYVAIPLTIFLIHAAIPGALGPMDPYGEGEYLAGGWLLMHGVAPWSDIYMIHGVFDDGIKAIIGFQIFGRTRWGATTGITMLLYPLYWVAAYYFAALLFVRRSFFVLGVAASLCVGVFVDWDLRFVFWPLILVLLARVLQRRTTARTVALVAALIAQAIFIPEMSYGIIACGAVVVLYEIYERQHTRFSLTDYPLTIVSAISTAVIGGGFVVWLYIEHALGGFVGYYEDFATAHSLTGGVPLFTNYAITTLPNALGVTYHATTPPPFISRYSLELYLPVVCLVATIIIVAVSLRRGRRLVVHDWLCVAGSILIGLYYQKGVSRADSGHIAEVFEVTLPLIVLLIYRGVVWAERALQSSSFTKRCGPYISKLTSHVGIPKIATPISLVTLILVLLIAPTTPAQTLTPVPHQVRAAVATPAPASPIKDGPGLGYNTDALPAGVVTDIQRVFDTYAGTNGPVFDFSNAPGIVNFLLARRPTSRFYDMGDVPTTTAEYQVISDLKTTKPIIILFNGVGLGAWDFIHNDVRESVLSDWILSNYQPLVNADGEVFLISDLIKNPKPLPHLEGTVHTNALYFRGAACTWGYIPNFLTTPNTPSIPATQPSESVGFHLLKHTKNGTIYQLNSVHQIPNFHWIAVKIAGAKGSVGLSISNIDRKTTRDISWVAQGSGTTQVEVGSCVQWRGFQRTLYLRYLGSGTPTSVTLIS